MMCMAAIRMIDNLSKEQQSKFIEQTYPSFVGAALYGYLFEGLHLRQLELRYLGIENGEGFFSKVVLNLLGVDTSKESSKGVFRGVFYQTAIKQLLMDEDPRINRIGQLIEDYRNKPSKQ